MHASQLLRIDLIVLAESDSYWLQRIARDLQYLLGCLRGHKLVVKPIEAASDCGTARRLRHDGGRRVAARHATSGLGFGVLPAPCPTPPGGIES